MEDEDFLDHDYDELLIQQITLFSITKVKQEFNQAINYMQKYYTQKYNTIMQIECNRLGLDAADISSE